MWLEIVNTSVCTSWRQGSKMLRIYGKGAFSRRHNERFTHGPGRGTFAALDLFKCEWHVNTYPRHTDDRCSLRLDQWNMWQGTFFVRGIFFPGEGGHLTPKDVNIRYFVINKDTPFPVSSRHIFLKVTSYVHRCWVLDAVAVLGG